MTYQPVGLPHGVAELLNAVTRMSQLTVEAMGHLSTCLLYTPRCV